MDGHLLCLNNNDKTTIDMARNPKSSENLVPFPKGVSGNPAGRPKSLAKAIKEMPVDAQTEIYGVLHHAISLRNFAEAKAYINQAVEDKNLGRYGFVFQLALKSLTGPHGWITLNDILDRLFGKPRVQADIRVRPSREVIVIGNQDVDDQVQPNDNVLRVDNEEEAEKLMHMADLEI